MSFFIFLIAYYIFQKSFGMKKNVGQTPWSWNHVELQVFMLLVATFVIHKSRFMFVSCWLWTRGCRVWTRNPGDALGNKSPLNDLRWEYTLLRFWRQNISFFGFLEKWYTCCYIILVYLFIILLKFRYHGNIWHILSNPLIL